MVLLPRELPARSENPDRTGGLPIMSRALWPAELSRHIVLFRPAFFSLLLFVLLWHLTVKVDAVPAVKALPEWLTVCSPADTFPLAAVTDPEWHQITWERCSLLLVFTWA
jgi:hypothetical protein